MSFNLLDTVKNYFNSEIVNQASSALGESSGGISKPHSRLPAAEIFSVIYSGATSLALQV
jgi:hypothetical protein